MELGGEAGGRESVKVVFAPSPHSFLQNVYSHNRSCGPLILPKGTSSSLAQEASTTARPDAMTTSSSHGAMGLRPFGLAVSSNVSRSEGYSTRARNTHVKTTPRNRCPTRMDVHSPWRASFLPEHRRGSQWSKSHIATGTAILTCCSSSDSSSSSDPSSLDSSSSESSSPDSSSLLSSSSSSSSLEPNRQQRYGISKQRQRLYVLATTTDTSRSSKVLAGRAPRPLGAAPPRPPPRPRPRPRPPPPPRGADERSLFGFPDLPMVIVSMDVNRRSCALCHARTGSNFSSGKVERKLRKVEGVTCISRGQAQRGPEPEPNTIHIDAPLRLDASDVSHQPSRT